MASSELYYLLKNCLFFIEQAKTGEISKEYTKIKGPGRSAKPEKHPFFRRLAPLVKFTLEKCERENGFM